MNKISVFFLIIFVFFILNANSYAASISEFKLQNGLKIIVIEDHRANAVFSSVWYRVGSAYEYNGLTGISHMLEHMMFTGTKRFSGDQIAKMISSNGGDQNAMTTSDYTVFFQQFTIDKLPISFELESERMHNLMLNEEKFKKELQVVMEERRMRTEDDPQSMTYERFNAAAFINSPYHNPVIGWMTDIEHFTLQDVIQWYKSWYGPNNAVIIVVGNVNPVHVFQLAQKYFADIKPIIMPQIKPRTEVVSVGPRFIHVYGSAQLPFLIMGYNVPSFLTAKQKSDAYALSVLSNVLAGGDSSRLANDLVRGSRISAGLQSDYNLYQRYDTVFTIYGVPTKDHTIKDLYLAILNEIKRLQTEPISVEELNRVKTFMMASYLYQKDSLMNRGIGLGMVEMGSSWKVDQQYLQEIQKITPEQLREVARKYFSPNNKTVAVLHPASKKMSP